MNLRTKIKVFDTVALLGVGALAGAAIRKELNTPAASRTWHGSLAFVPYDFRPPTPARVRASWWSPENSRVITRQPFGLGWTVNAGRVVRLVQQRR